MFGHKSANSQIPMQIFPSSSFMADVDLQCESSSLGVRTLHSTLSKVRTSASHSGPASAKGSTEEDEASVSNGAGDANDSDDADPLGARRSACLGAVARFA